MFGNPSKHFATALSRAYEDEAPPMLQRVSSHLPLGDVPSGRSSFPARTVKAVDSLLLLSLRPRLKKECWISKFEYIFTLASLIVLMLWNPLRISMVGTSMVAFGPLRSTMNLIFSIVSGLDLSFLMRKIGEL